MADDWPWSSASNAELFAGLAFLVIAVPALMYLLLWLGTHWPGRTPRGKSDPHKNRRPS